MNGVRPHRFPPLAQIAAGQHAGQSAAQYQQSLADGFRQGMDEGYRAGHESGHADGLAEGREAGRREGLRSGRDEAMQQTKASFEQLARPLDAMLERLETLQADYQSALRKEVVDLVARVARQVIRCELVLQPAQLMALVDETLAAMPPTRKGIEVHLNPEDLQRISDIDAPRAQRWKLVPDPRLESGECLVKAGDHEADAGCAQRLAACVEQVRAQLLDGAEALAPAAAAPAPAMEAA